MQLTIGSNRLLNTDGIVKVRGTAQIILEWGAFSSELLLTMDLYGIGGSHIARLRRNQWTFNDYERFKLDANTKGFVLVDTKSGQMVLEARIVGGDSVVITQGTFLNSTGNEIQITSENWLGAEKAQTPTDSAAQLTSPPFAADEIESIRAAVMGSRETVECPRCGCPLTRERLESKTQLDSLLVSCIICRRNLVVHGQS